MCKLKIIFLLNFLHGFCIWYFVKCDDDFKRISDQILKTLHHVNHYTSYNQSCFYNNQCFGKNEICNFWGICQCKSHHEFNENLNECVQCPGLGEFCFKDCCNHKSLRCINNRCLCVNDVGSYNLCHVGVSKTGVFMTASQIALSAALMMAIVALIMVIYRLCAKPRIRHDLDAATISRAPNGGNSNFLRESLSSMQIRILSRLRDRPPSYDDVNSRQNSTQQNISTIPTVVSIPEAPPPYEADRGMSTNQRPPPYSEIIINPSNLSASSQEGQNNLSSSTDIKSTTDNENQTDIQPKQNL